MLVYVNGKRWDMVFAPCVDCDGSCDAPTDKNKQIKIAPRLRKDQRRLMEVVVHELIHASDWSKDETWVEPVAEDIARVLWKLGYRRSEPREL